MRSGEMTVLPTADLCRHDGISGPTFQQGLA